MAYTVETRAEAKEKYLSGWSCREIAKDMDVSNDTVWRWCKGEDWKTERRVLSQSRDNLLAQLDNLSSGKITESKARKIAMISRALARLEQIENKRKKDAVAKPQARLEFIGDMRVKILDYAKGRLRPYQWDFFMDGSRFRNILKGRQVGFSDLLGLEMVAKGMDRERDQNLMSTSKEQGAHTVKYSRMHMKALGITELGKKNNYKIVLPGGAEVRVLPHSFRSAQGYPGDLYLDEFAWYLHSQRMWEAVVPTVTAVGGDVTVGSTPYEAGPQSMFWRIAVNDGDDFPLFSRHVVDIDTAMKGGLAINLEELKSLFDKDTFDRLYRCKFFTDDESFFTLAELNACRGECLGRWVGNDRRAGWDMAKTTDSSEVVAVEKLKTQVFMRGLETWKRLAYNQQRDKLIAALLRWRIGRLNADLTGVGQGVRDFVTPTIPSHVTQHWYTFDQAFKAKLATGVKKLVEEARLMIPHDDRILVSQFLNIKRTATQRGISYDIKRNATGHGDRFWALALACKDVGFGGGNWGVDIL